MNSIILRKNNILLLTVLCVRNDDQVSHVGDKLNTNGYVYSTYIIL